MAVSGIMQRFKGKVQAAVLYLGAGGIVDAASGIGAKAQLALKTALPVTAVANTDFSLSLPPGAIVLSANVYTTTAYTGATVALQLGSTLGAADVVAATNIKATGFVLLVVAAGAPAAIASLGAAPNLFVRIIQTATFTAVGNGTLVIEYMMP
jgi:hypothetical protein